MHHVQAGADVEAKLQGITTLAKSSHLTTPEWAQNTRLRLFICQRVFWLYVRRHDETRLGINHLGVGTSLTCFSQTCLFSYPLNQ